MGQERRYESGPPNAVPPMSCVPFCVDLSSPLPRSFHTSQHRTMLSLIRDLVPVGRQTENGTMKKAPSRGQGEEPVGGDGLKVSGMAMDSDC